MWAVIILMRVLRGLLFLLFLVYWPYCKLVTWNNKKKRIPPITNPLLFKSAKEIAHLIKSRKVRCTDVIEAYIQRIRLVEPLLNSVVDNRFEAAMAEAKEIDALIAGSSDVDELFSNKPLLGVPISIKETIPVKGLSNNGGRQVPKDRIAVHDNEAVRNLRNAGAIPLVVTNTPELCMFWETYNLANGRTNNPFDTRRTAGGSSGGECALLGAAGSVVGLGSDVAGSGRLPAMFCGVFGHRPTSDLISVADHMPGSEDPDWPSFFVLAPLARYACDLPLILKNAAPKETTVLRLDQEVDLRSIRIFYMEEFKSHLMKGVHPEIKEAIRKSAMHFRQYGIEPKEVVVKHFDESLAPTFVLMLNMKSPHSIFQRSDDTEDWTMCDVLRETLKKISGCSKHTTYAILFGWLKKIAEIVPSRNKETMKNLKLKIIKNLEDMLGDNGVLILPVFTDPAHQHYRMYYKLLNTVYLSFGNLIGVPATACPTGLSKKGLPIGVQIIANKYQDRLTLAVARELEKVFGGWIPPCDQHKINNNI